MQTKKTNSNKSKPNTASNKSKSSSSVKKTKNNVKKQVKKEAVKALNNKNVRIAIIIIAVLIILAMVTIYLVNEDLRTIINVEIYLFLNQPVTNIDIISSAKGIAPIIGASLQMTVIDVGQGDSILIETPDGKNMLVDIGSKDSKVWGQVDSTLKSKEITTLDYVMITHTDSDHINQLVKLCNAYEIKSFYIPKTNGEVTATWTKGLNAIQNEMYSTINGQERAEIKYNIGAFQIEGDGWTMDCYSYDEQDYPNINKGANATNKNAVSPICVLEYAGKSIVLTGDSNFTNEKYLINKGYFDNVDADVLKVGHHGSKSSTSQEFLDKIDAEYAIISTNGKDYGHPEPTLLERLDQYRDLIMDNDINGFDMVYRTDKDGSVVVQIGNDSTLNIVSQNQEDNNRTQPAVKMVIYNSNIDIIIVARPQMQEYFWNCA